MIGFHGLAFRMLNAFRHQRKKRMPARAPRGPGPLMLNAFRHQRKKRKRLGFATSAPSSCSTPSGIKGRNAYG